MLFLGIEGLLIEETMQLTTLSFNSVASLDFSGEIDDSAQKAIFAKLICRETYRVAFRARQSKEKLMRKLTYVT